MMTKSGRRRGKRGNMRRDCSWASPMTSSKVAKSGHGYDFSQRMYSLENLEKMQPGRKLWARHGIDLLVI